MEEPGPVITLNTPGGTPASKRILASSRVVTGVMLAGFITILLPSPGPGQIYKQQNHGKVPGGDTGATPIGSRTQNYAWALPRAGKGMFYGRHLGEHHG
jgi:hypothetical protein